MKREFTLDEWRERRSGAGVSAHVNRGRRPRRGRRRDPEERAAIIRGTRALMRSRQSEGRIVRIGEREYQIPSQIRKL
jgi:hypothetical protein